MPSNNREEILKKLRKISSSGNGLTHSQEIEAFADFIIADRKRIVKPLIKFVSEYPNWKNGFTVDADRAIDETLKLAGEQ